MQHKKSAEQRVSKERKQFFDNLRHLSSVHFYKMVDDFITDANQEDLIKVNNRLLNLFISDQAMQRLEDCVPADTMKEIKDVVYLMTRQNDFLTGLHAHWKHFKNYNGIRILYGEHGPEVSIDTSIPSIVKAVLRN